jgi:signal recognition particle receptor subunit beta
MMKKVYNIYNILELYEDDYDDYYEEGYEETVVPAKKVAVKKPEPVNNNKSANKNSAKNSPDIKKINGGNVNITGTNINKDSTFKQSNTSDKINITENKEVVKKLDKHHIKSASELNEIKYPKIDYNLEVIKGKTNISLVIIGHVDSGKSTLMGHLLYLLGEINDKTMAKYEKESKKIGKNTFHFAWAMDEDTEERKRGVTVDIAYKYFETANKKVTAMDAPGHKDFIPNMITGTSAADAALLVIDCNKGCFESGFFSGGQTKEHAVLARSLGVKQIIVCCNKLEMIEWSKERYFLCANFWSQRHKLNGG